MGQVGLWEWEMVVLFQFQHQPAILLRQQLVGHSGQGWSARLLSSGSWPPTWELQTAYREDGNLRLRPASCLWELMRKLRSGSWLKTLTEMELWRYLWTSIIHAILKLQSMKNLEQLIPCFSRATSKFVEASVGVNKSNGQCLSTPFVF